MNKFNIDNKVAIITGGSGLLGTTFCNAIAEIGGIPVILDKNIKEAKLLSDSINKSFQINSLAIKTDITSEASLKNALKLINKKYKKIDILVNNAANNHQINQNVSNSLEQFSLANWQNDIDVGLKGPFLCTKIFGHEMSKNKSGVIINISSDLGIIAPDQRLYETKKGKKTYKAVTYSVIKHGIIGLTKYTASYWSNKGIRSNALCPGGVFNNQPKEFVNKVKKLIPLNRMANVNEYKSAIQFLCSDASSYMNGSCLIMDGGRTIW
ncbi:SDR family oxidoreductase [Alphaproteobacteria bacterium]|nr:SDR family oxidoreductase [Alphaproteobacteria bacterium]